MTRKRKERPAATAATTADWYAVGAELHRELGDQEPAHMARVVAERYPTIDPEALYRLGVGYARCLARGLR